MKLFKNLTWLILSSIIISAFNDLNSQTVHQQECSISMTSPTQNAELKQARIDGGKVQTNWTFHWTACPSAQRYHLYVIGPGALNPIVNNESIKGTYYTDRAIHYGITSLTGWTCKVRAFENGKWGEWSEMRTFNAMPVPASITGNITYPANWGNKEKLKKVILTKNGSTIQTATVKNNKYTFLNVIPGIEYTIQPFAFGTNPENITLICNPNNVYKKNFEVWRLPIDD